MKNSTYLWNALFLSLSLAACSGQDESQTVKAAADDSVATMGWEEFRKSVHESAKGFFVVDGDIRLNSEQELRDYYEEHFTQGALIIDNRCTGIFCSGGRVDSKWNDTQKLNLTYCVSASAFGGDYARVVDAVKFAAEAWESIVHVNFVHRSEFDGNCNASQTNVVFDVQRSTDPNFLAAAFFPYQARADRTLEINLRDLDADTRVTLIGVIRHELGHTLGFRHEHIRISGGPGCVEDSDWRSLTDYDSTSVMHYPWCGGTAGWGLTFSELDLAGAASVYGQPPVRIGHLDTSGTLYVKEGGLDGTWVIQMHNVVDFQLEGNRIGVLLQDGSVYVKEGALDETWSFQGGNIKRLQLEGNRIGVLENNGDLYVKEGGLDATWHREMDGISDFQLEGARIGVLFADARFYVKEGPLDAGWVLLSSSAKKFQLDGRRVGVLDTSSSLFVKDDGVLDANFIQIRSGSLLNNVSDFQFENTRLAVREKSTNDLYASDQRLGSTMSFSLLSDAIAGFQLENSRVAVLGTDGALYVKSGTLDQSWVLESDYTTAFQLYGARIFVQDFWAGLHGTEGGLGAAWSQLNGNNRAFKVAGMNLN